MADQITLAGQRRDGIYEISIDYVMLYRKR